MMSDVSVPDWIMQIKEADERLEAQSELRNQKMIAASKTLKAECPEFWKSFLKELELNLCAASDVQGNNWEGRSR
jgi:hypothetical protein